MRNRPRLSACLPGRSMGRFGLRLICSFVIHSPRTCNPLNRTCVVCARRCLRFLLVSLVVGVGNPYKLLKECEDADFKLNGNRIERTYSYRALIYTLYLTKKIIQRKLHEEFGSLQPRHHDQIPDVIMLQHPRQESLHAHPPPRRLHLLLVPHI